jgi:hypothetical protein
VAKHGVVLEASVHLPLKTCSGVIARVRLGPMNGLRIAIPTRRRHPNLHLHPCRTIEGYEAMHAIRKGQVRWIAKGDTIAQRQFIHTIFGIAA